MEQGNGHRVVEQGGGHKVVEQGLQSHPGTSAVGTGGLEGACGEQQCQQVKRGVAVLRSSIDCRG